MAILITEVDVLGDGSFRVEGVGRLLPTPCDVISRGVVVGSSGSCAVGYSRCEPLGARNLLSLVWEPEVACVLGTNLDRGDLLGRFLLEDEGGEEFTMYRGAAVFSLCRDSTAFYMPYDDEGDTWDEELPRGRWLPTSRIQFDTDVVMGVFRLNGADPGQMLGEIAIVAKPPPTGVMAKVLVYESEVATVEVNWYAGADALTS